MFVIIDQYGCYLTKLWTARPSELKNEIPNFVLNSEFHHDFEKCMRFDSKQEANSIFNVLGVNTDAHIKELKQVIYHTGDQRYLKSVNIEQAYSNGKLVAKNTLKWTKSLDEALPFVDQESLKAVVALTERGENLNGNFRYVTVKYV